MYIRRIIKSPSNVSITNSLLIDYINRFWINDVDARIQLFDLKKKYSFLTTPGVDQYNMPLYDLQIESPTQNPQTIQMYPVYQGFLGPCYINGVEVPLYTQKQQFFRIWPNIVQNMQVVTTGNGTAGPYHIQLPILPSVPPPNPPFNPILRGHVDITGIMATGNNIDPPLAIGGVFNTTIPVTSVNAQVFLTSIDAQGNNILVTDSGQFLNTNVNYGLLMAPGKPPVGNTSLTPVYTTTNSTINYLTGEINVTFPVAVPIGNNINAEVYFFQSGLPRGILFYDNVLTLRSVPALAYRVELDAYLSPAAFLNGADAIQFGYMSEYIARGAARKILSDTGDIEQMQFYEPLFIEQEQLVWKRSQRQWTATRTETIYSQGNNVGGGYGFNNFGGSV